MILQRFQFHFFFAHVCIQVTDGTFWVLVLLRFQIFYAGIFSQQFLTQVVEWCFNNQVHDESQYMGHQKFCNPSTDLLTGFLGGNFMMLFSCASKNRVLTRGKVRYSSGWCSVKLLYQMSGIWIIKVEKLMRPNNRKILHDSRSVNRAVSIVREQKQKRKPLSRFPLISSCKDKWREMDFTGKLQSGN